MSDSQSKKNILDESKINSQSFLYDWIVLLLISLLVFVIVIPPVIWNEEESKIFEARERMLDLAYALKTYHHLTGEYTDDEELLFETIMQVRDSLIAISILFALMIFGLFNDILNWKDRIKSFENVEQKRIEND